MTTRTYPCKGWILMPSFKPVEVEFVEKYKSLGDDYGDMTAKQKIVRRDEIFNTKEAALDGGHARLERHRAQIAKLQAGHDKKLAALKKAIA